MKIGPYAVLFLMFALAFTLVGCAERTHTATVFPLTPNPEETVDELPGCEKPTVLKVHMQHPVNFPECKLNNIYRAVNAYAKNNCRYHGCTKSPDQKSPTLVFVRTDQYGWDCSKNLVWMREWNSEYKSNAQTIDQGNQEVRAERFFALAWARCALLNHTKIPESDEVNGMAEAVARVALKEDDLMLNLRDVRSTNPKYVKHRGHSNEAVELILESVYAHLKKDAKRRRIPDPTVRVEHGWSTFTYLDRVVVFENVSMCGYSHRPFEPGKVGEESHELNSIAIAYYLGEPRAERIRAKYDYRDVCFSGITLEAIGKSVLAHVEQYSPYRNASSGEVAESSAQARSSR